MDSIHKSYSFLIIEASLAARVIIRSQFLDLRHHLDLAWDLESTKEFITFKEYDLILVDIKFDQISNFINQIKQSFPNCSKTPIIGLSSYESYSLNQQKELVFPKPLTKKDIAKIVAFLDTKK